MGSDRLDNGDGAVVTFVRLSETDPQASREPLLTQTVDTVSRMNASPVASGAIHYVAADNSGTQPDR